MKTIVTHASPDLDAITSSWLIHRFLPGWKNAHFEFVSAGSTFEDKDPDENTNIIHVDTGFGQFDHHQTKDEICASTLVFDHLKKKGYLRDADVEALERLVNVVNRYDHFKEVYLEDPDDDMHDFSLNYLIRSVRVKVQDDLEVLQLTESMLDGLLIQFKNKVNAERALKKGFTFTSAWGKTIALESENDDTLKLSFRMGYDMTIRKSEQYGHIRIKLHPKVRKSLKDVEKAILKKDPDATWYYHPSGKMLLNNSAKSKDAVPSKLSLNQVINIIKKI